MRRIGFLACAATLPTSEPNTDARRRADAYEHDLQISALAPAFARHGLALEVIDWRAPLEAFAGLEMVLLGTAWDYQDCLEPFLAKLRALDAAGIKVQNPPEVAEWNAHKTYLQALAQSGVATIPTLWRDDAERRDLEAGFDQFASAQLVVKRQVGAGAIGQQRISRHCLPDADWRFGHKAMIQPFLAQITEQGELSFIFIDGAFSHALRKRAACGDYRIQSLYGGYEEPLSPTAEDLDAAQSVLNALPFAPLLYARIDMLRGQDGALLLVEAEMIEPYLYPEQGPELGRLLAGAVARRMDGQ